MVATNTSTATLLTLGVRAAGLAILWAGAIKSVAPHAFRAHLDSLGFVPRNVLRNTVTIAAALEVAWGTALVVDFAPSLVLPVTIVMLGVLSVVSWWGVHAGKAKDCGCYGGFVQPSIRQSVGINAGFAALAALALWNHSPETAAQPWKIVVVVVAGVLAGGMAAYAQWFEMKQGRLLVNTRPLKV